MMAKALNNWTVMGDGSLSSLFWDVVPPEGKSFSPRLMGEDKPGHTIITSRIISATGCTVTTKSGSLYSLCNQYNMLCPDKHFYDLLIRWKLKLDRKEPLKELLALMNG